MDTEAGGQLGGLDAGVEVRKRLAERSRGWGCGVCGGGKVMEVVMREREEEVREMGEVGRREEVVVPEELRLAFREDLGKAGGSGGGGEVVDEVSGGRTNGLATEPVTTGDDGETLPARTSSVQPQQDTQPVQAVQTPPLAPRRNDQVPAWIDKAIYSVIAALIFMLFRKLG